MAPPEWRPEPYSAAARPAGDGLIQQVGAALVTALALVDGDASAAFVRTADGGYRLAASSGCSADERALLLGGPFHRAQLAAGRVALATPGVPVRLKSAARSRARAMRSAHEAAVLAVFPTAYGWAVTLPSSKIWGVVELYFRRARRVSPPRLLVCESFIGQLGWTVERDRRATAAERRAGAPQVGTAAPPADRAAQAPTRESAAPSLAGQQLSADRALRLQTVAAALSRAITPVDVAEVVVDQCLSAVDAAAGAVALHHAGAGELEVIASVGHILGVTDDCHTVAVGAAVPLAEVARAREPLFFRSRAALRTHYPATDAAVRGRPAALAALAVLPLVVDHEVAAVLSLGFAAPRAFDANEQRFILALARLAAQALERARLQQAAHAASAAKSDFLAMMSHELRTPLNAIVGYTGLLADEVVGPVNSTQRDQLRRVQEQARHLLTLVEEILTLTRAESADSVPRLALAEPATLLQDLVDVVAPSAARKGLTLTCHADRGIGPVSIDADKVRQMLAQLLTNAVKFTASGTIEATVRADSAAGRRALLFTVRDTGVGIAPQHLSRIFEPFWQAEQRHARRAAGTGLGLNVTRRLAQLLDADVSVQSTPGRGSTFTVRLPVAQP